MVEVIKFSGEKEKFNAGKILSTLKRAGATNKQAKEIISRIKERLHENITTREILDIIKKELKNNPVIAAKYDLKRAIMALGPTGYPFEKYFSKILNKYGYDTKTNQIIKGKRINQEIDIIASKKYTYMIECKYHNDQGKHTDLKQAMYTYARFLDINTRKKDFDFPWLVTNTHCSRDSTEYAKGVDLKVTSWRYPEKWNLQELIETKGLYPITILKSIDERTKNQLFNAGIIMLKELQEIPEEKLKKLTDLDTNSIKKIINDARSIYSN